MFVRRRRHTLWDVMRHEVLQVRIAGYIRLQFFHVVFLELMRSPDRYADGPARIVQRMRRCRSVTVPEYIAVFTLCLAKNNIDTDGARVLIDPLHFYRRCDVI